MDRDNTPYKIESIIDTYRGDWSAEQIANGEAGEPTTQSTVVWYEDTSDGTIEIHDPQRIADLEHSLENT